MTSCIACPDREEHDPDHEEGWACCRRARDRMAAALRDIPERCEELAGLGYVQRDDLTPKLTYPPGHRHAGDLVPHLDPVAHVLTSGPTNGASSQPRVGGSALPSVPIRVDPTDLLGRSRPASLTVVDLGLYASDQVGHLAVATELEFWARDWADLRGEGCPMPTVRALARWLLDRLDWACEHHPALDEFAGKLTHLRNTLTAACGAFDPLPTPVDRPCPACGWWALNRPPDSDYIVCGNCDRALTDDEYRDHLEDVIKTNWTVVDPDDARTWPMPTTPVWARCDDLSAVTIGYIMGRRWRSWGGSELEQVSYWAPISYPADPGPAKDDPAPAPGAS